MTQIMKSKYNTRQELFTNAYKGLESQGWKKSMGSYGKCLYRYGNLKCAIGWSIPDETYKDKFERVDLSLPFKAAGISKEDKFFAGLLQGAHDNACGPMDLKNRMQEFAARFSLEVPKS